MPEALAGAGGSHVSLFPSSLLLLPFCFSLPASLDSIGLLHPCPPRGGNLLPESKMAKTQTYEVCRFLALLAAQGLQGSSLLVARKSLA